MENYKCGEIRELVGLYILPGNEYAVKNVGLCRSDGIVCSQKISGLMSNKIRKDIIKVFHENFVLKIQITTDLKIVNFLDVTFVLCTERYQLYKKQNDTTYVIVSPNHPPNIITVLTGIISKRIKQHLTVPHLSIMTYCLRVCTKKTTRIKKTRQTAWTWKQTSRTFLKVVCKHYPKTNKFHKRYTRSNVKVSYSCLPNFTSMKSHKNIILYEETAQDYAKCSCQQKDPCPVETNCCDKELINQCNFK